MKKPMFTFALRLCAFVLILSHAAFSTAQSYPTKPIRLIVPFPPGGGNDIVGRYLGQKLTPRLGQQIVIDNRAGADAIIGTQLAANAVADGYTLLNLMAGVKIMHVAYKGGGPAITDVMAGHVPVLVNTLAPVLPHIRSGRLKILGVGSAHRTAVLPETPTIAEAGVAGFEASVWWGMLGPAGMPRNIVSKLNLEVGAVVREAESVKWFTLQAADPLSATPEEFAKRIAADIGKWNRIAKEAGISVQ